MVQLGLALNRDPPTMSPARSRLPAAVFGHRLRLLFLTIPLCCSAQLGKGTAQAGKTQNENKQSPQRGHPAQHTWIWNQLPGLTPQFKTLLVCALGK